MSMSTSVLTEEEIQLVKNSFQVIQPMSEQISAVFYDRLFKIMPDFSEIFRHTDMPVQTRKFAQTLEIMISYLDRLEVISAKIEQLGTFHQQFGVRKEHFTYMGEALLWTLERTIHPYHFTPAVAAAWIKVYTVIASLATRQY
jgi:hemoglobin-like flavoprotein